MVEKWGPVLGPRDLRNPQDLRDFWDPRMPSTSGSHGPPGPLDPRTPLVPHDLGKLPMPFEIQSLNTQKL